MNSIVKTLGAILVAGSMSLSMVGCGKGVIDHVVVTPAQDMKSLEVVLFFQQNVNLSILGTLDLPPYGSLFMSPSTTTQPFQLGFDLNTGILLDQKYVNLQRTNLLPNGAPTMLPYPVVQIKGEQPISADFDLYGYLDVDQQAWMGTAALFGSGTQSNIPSGLAVSQVFLRDKAGNPTLFASVFGPSPDSTVKSGGVAVFANVKSLLANAKDASSQSYKPEKKAYLHGIGQTLHEMTGKEARELERYLP